MAKQLTEKQKKYLKYLALDFGNAEIARAMGIKEETLRIYYQHRTLMHMRLRKRCELVEYAKQHYGEQAHG